MPEQIKKFLDEHGFTTFVTATYEKLRVYINSLFASHLQEVTDAVTDAKADIQSTKASGIAQINARVATVAPMVNVKTVDNVDYIYANQADWTEGETYILPDADPETGDEISVVYNSTCFYVGGKRD